MEQVDFPPLKIEISVKLERRVADMGLSVIVLFCGSVENNLRCVKPIFLASVANKPVL